MASWIRAASAAHAISHARRWPLVRFRCGVEPRHALRIWIINRTFARNIVYVVSGARFLTREGCGFTPSSRASIGIFSKRSSAHPDSYRQTIAIAVTLVLATLGTLYVGASFVLRPRSFTLDLVGGIRNLGVLQPVFPLLDYSCCAVTATLPVHRAKTLGRLTQLAVSAIPCWRGWDWSAHRWVTLPTGFCSACLLASSCVSTVKSGRGLPRITLRSRRSRSGRFGEP